MGRGYVRKYLYIGVTIGGRRGRERERNDGQTLEPKRRSGMTATAAAGVRLCIVCVYLYIYIYTRSVSAEQCARAFSFCIGPLIYSVHPSCCRCSGGGGQQFLNLKTVSLVVVVVAVAPFPSDDRKVPTVRHRLRAQTDLQQRPGRKWFYFFIFKLSRHTNSSATLINFIFNQLSDG